MTDQPTYPFATAEGAVLGPDVRATPDGMTICWKGANYRRDYGELPDLEQQLARVREYAATTDDDGPRTREQILSIVGNWTGPEICELPHQTIAEEDECERQRLTVAAPLTAAEEDDAGRTYEKLRHADLDDLGLTAADLDRLTAQGIPVHVVTGPPNAHAAAVARAVNGGQPGPAEHCGDLKPDFLVGLPTECVLRPGHSGSHADDRGCRWWASTKQALGDQETAPAATEATDTAGLREQIIAALKRAPFHELRADYASNGPLIITAYVNDLADAALAAVERHLDIADAEVWCKTCRRVWEGKHHRCETDAENELRVLREDFAVARAQLAEYENARQAVADQRWPLEKAGE